MSHTIRVTDYPYMGKDTQTLELRYTPQGKAVVNLRLPLRNRVKDTQSGEWRDETEPIWVDAPFWEQEAERIVNTVRNGDRVTVEGTLIKRTYQKQDGGMGEAFELKYPKFLGVIPGNRNGGGAPAAPQPQWPQAAQPGMPQGGATYGAPQGGAANDPWASQQPPF